jgi:hypothetical protein
MKVRKSLLCGIAIGAAICLLHVVGISQPLPQQPFVHPINILEVTNLEQCKVVIKGLKKLGGFNDTYGQYWLVEQPGRTNGLPIVLSENNNTVQYDAVLISVDFLDRNVTNHVSEIQTQTEIMSVDEARKLGLQLCSVLNIDPSEFLAWCNKVGNRWLDTPLFSTGVHDNKINKEIGFQTLHGFNPKKPWLINVVIQDY